MNFKAAASFILLTVRLHVVTSQYPQYSCFTDTCTDGILNSNDCRGGINFWTGKTSNEEHGCARVAYENSACVNCLPATMTGANLCGTDTCTQEVMNTPSPSPAGGSCGSGILTAMTDETTGDSGNLNSAKLACKRVAIEQAVCRQCLPPQPEPVCAPTCTEEVLNTAYVQGGTCGSAIAFKLATNSESGACKFVAEESVGQEGQCACCHPDVDFREANGCESPSAMPSEMPSMMPTTKSSKRGSKAPKGGYSKGSKTPKGGDNAKF